MAGELKAYVVFDHGCARAGKGEPASADEYCGLHGVVGLEVHGSDNEWELSRQLCGLLSLEAGLTPSAAPSLHSLEAGLTPTAAPSLQARRAMRDRAPT